VGADATPSAEVVAEVPVVATSNVPPPPTAAPDLVIDTTSVIPFESLYAGEARTTDPLHDLCTIPVDDIIIERVNKLHRSRFPPVDPEQIPQPCLQSVFDAYSAPWVRVKRNYCEYERATLTTVWDLDPPEFEVDVLAAASTAAAVDAAEVTAPILPDGSSVDEALNGPPSSVMDQLSVKQKFRLRAGSIRVKTTETGT
jgi:hypothetical protein